MPNATVTETINGTTYEWTGLNMDQKPQWQQTTQGNAFQFSEFYKGPSLEISNRHNKTSDLRGRNRYYYYIFQLITLFSCLPSYANQSDNSQSSIAIQVIQCISNFATQVLTGPMTENSAMVLVFNVLELHYPSAHLPQLLIAIKRPQDYIFHTPVYNEATDSDGNLHKCG